MEPIVQFKKRGGGGGGNKSMRVKKADSDEEDATVVIKPVINNSAMVNTASSSSSTPAVSVTTVYESKREIVPQSYAGDATATIQVDTSYERDAVALHEKHKDDGRKLMSLTKSNTFGPARAPTFLRATSRFDYQPDICKDYKETGFCGYGDNCKFLHDRGDYKSGWQMEVEWDKKQNDKKRKLQNLEDSALKAMMKSTGTAEEGGDGDEDEDDTGPKIDENGEENYEIPETEEFPFACHICRESFTDPIVTLCGHYFCSECAHNRNKSNTRCAVCDKQTFGVFNKARKLIKHINSLKGTTGGGSEPQPVNASVRSQVARKKGSWEAVTEE